MRIRAISGYGGKTPACFLVELSGRRFLLDLGEGPEPGVFPDVSGLGRVDAVLISHSHKDHVGGLGLLERIGSPPVYSTTMVRAISGDPALDASRDLPLRGVADILGVTIKTGRASHAPGGIWMRLGGEGGVLYTGDWTLESPIYGFDQPPKAAVLICDASYGTHDVPLADHLPELVAEAARGALLLPMPPAGRGLDAAVVLSEAGLDISICAAHRAVTTRLVASTAGEISQEARQRLGGMLGKAGELTATSRACGVMIAATADAAGGVARALVSRFAADRSAAIIFTGHLANGTPGKQKLAQGKARSLRWNVHPRSSDFRWLVDCVRPRAILPAFIGEPGLGEFIAANPDLPFVRGEVDID